MLNNCIAISGRSGCGNTSVSEAVAKHLNFRCINYTFRTVAKEHNISLQEISAQAEETDFWDKHIDARQIEYAKEGNCIVGSRLSIWLLPEAIVKVYLRAKEEVRAERILRREGGDIKTVLKNIRDRDMRDRNRYLNLYNIDTSEYKDVVNLIIDTEKESVSAIALRIVSLYKEIQSQNSK